MSTPRAIALAALLHAAPAAAYPDDWEAVIADVRLGYGGDLGGSNLLVGAAPENRIWWQAPSLHAGLGVHVPISWEETFVRVDASGSFTPGRRTGLRVGGVGPLWADMDVDGNATELVEPRYESFTAELVALFGREWVLEDWDWKLYPSAGLLVALPHNGFTLPLFAWSGVDVWEGPNPIAHGDVYTHAAHADLWGGTVDMEAHFRGWIELHARAGMAPLGPAIARAVHTGDESYRWEGGYTTFGRNTLRLHGALYTTFGAEARLTILEHVSPVLRYQGDMLSFGRYTPNIFANDHRTRYGHHRVELAVLFRFHAVPGS